MKTKSIITLIFLITAFVFTAAGASAVSAENGSVEPGSDRVIFIRDLRGNETGEGSGRTADDPLRSEKAPKEYDPDSDRPKKYLLEPFFQAIDELRETGGTVVICGRVTLYASTFFPGDSSYFVTPEFEKPIRFTSVYDGTDYRETAGACVLISGNVEISVNGESVWEDLDIYTELSERLICFNGNRTLIGSGVRCRPADDRFSGVPEYYVSLAAGHRYDKLKGPAETELTVLSGTYNKIVGGAWGTVKANWEDRNSEDAEKREKFYKYAYTDVDTYLTLGADVTVLREICGSNGKAQPFGGNTNIVINGGKYKCAVTGAGKSSFLNGDASVRITVNGGDFAGVSALRAISPDPSGAAPRTATLDLRAFPEDNTGSFDAILQSASGFDEGDILMPEWYLSEYEKTLKTVGDLDGDGSVSSEDLVKMKEYIANHDPSTVLFSVIGRSCDLNGDGIISSLDVVRLKGMI